MSRSNDYIETSFGVELYKRFEDVLGELEDIEIGLKNISREVGLLGNDIDKSERIKIAKEMRGVTYDSAQFIRDIRRFLDFYFTQAQEFSQVLLERDVYMLLFQISQWDCSDVRDLRNWILEFREICKTIRYRPEDLLRLENLHAGDVPEDVRLFPVYAVDKHDYCLCGNAGEEIRHIEEVRELMAENPGKYHKFPSRKRQSR